jgi:hypothetical protein
VLIHEETDDGRLVGNWEEVRHRFTVVTLSPIYWNVYMNPARCQVTSETVLTLREVYESVNKRGYMVDYKRIPITDERCALRATCVACCPSPASDRILC